MAQTNLLLIKHVPHLGAEGDRVKVRSGYARNFLLPRKFAVPVSRANEKQINALLQAREMRESKELDAAKALAEQIGKTHLGIPVKTGEGGKMFGSVTAQHLAEQLEAAGIPLDRRKILLKTPIKELGPHQIEIRLHSEVTATLEIDIVSENPIKPSES